MAGRPVAARGGGGLLYGLIAFAIVSVLCLGFAIWQLTNTNKLEGDLETKNRRLQQYGNPPAYYQDEASARGSTVFDVMSDDLRQLAKLVAGKTDAVRPALVEASNRLLREIAEASPNTIEAGDTLLTALQKLHGAYAELKSKSVELTANLEEARLENQSLNEGLKTVRDEFEQQVAELKEETARLEQEKAEQLAAKDEQLAQQQAEAEALGKELSDSRVEQQRKERENDIAMTRLREELDSLRDQIRVYKVGFDPYSVLTKADGRVLRAIPGSDVIYIDLGRQDRIRPGLRFEVFSPMGGGQQEDFRGKATVEVTEVSEATAECRVLRTTPGRPIVEDDVVVNIAYERNRLPKFVVRGDFDLNYDGDIDVNGVEKVTAIIQAWGGQVMDEVDETTDFLVVGMGPRVPTLSGEPPVTDVIRELTDSRLDQLERYRRDIDQARTLYIPVITQSQFLFLTGYSGRGPILTD